MFNYCVTGSVITIILGFVLTYSLPPMAESLTDILLFMGLNPRCGALECFAAMTMAFFLIGYGMGAIFFIKGNKSA